MGPHANSIRPADHSKSSRITSVDDHVIEPHALVRSSTFEAASAGPSVVRKCGYESRRCDQWEYEDMRGAMRAGDPGIGRMKSKYVLTPVTYDQIEPGCFQQDARLGVPRVATKQNSSHRTRGFRHEIRPSSSRSAPEFIGVSAPVWPDSKFKRLHLLLANVAEVRLADEHLGPVPEQVERSSRQRPSAYRARQPADRASSSGTGP